MPTNYTITTYVGEDLIEPLDLARIPNYDAAAFNARFDAQGHVVKQGAQVVIGANDQYIGLCRKHWMLGDLGPDFNGQGTGD